MKRTSLFALLLTFGFLVGTVPGQWAFGSTSPSSLSQTHQQPEHPQRVIPNPPNQDRDQDHPPSQNFTGRIVSMQGVCVLKDLYNKVLYQLDDQQEAHSYTGKIVTVTGMLDKASQTILVEDIQPADPSK